MASSWHLLDLLDGVILMHTSSLTGASVLCIDDDADTLLLLSHILKRHGAKVTTSSSAEHAIARLVDSRFDVVISDIQMPPGLDGYDLAHALRQMEKDDDRRPETPLVAVSGIATSPSAKRRFADFQVYMQKPVDQKRLVHVVKRLVEADGETVKAGSLAQWEIDQARSRGKTARHADHHTENADECR